MEVMDNDNEKMIRKTSVAFMCALIGKFMLAHRKAYGSNPEPHEVSDFCFYVTKDYDGNDLSVNTESTEKFIINCMEKARTERTYATNNKKILADNDHCGR